jgi:TolA-binding protein
VGLLLDALPLSTVLTAITEPLGILWEVTDNAVHFCSAQEVTKEALASYRVRYAERALTDAIERYPIHALKAFAEFELGNLQYARGMFQDAAARYERLAVTTPRSPVSIEASYNMGLALRRLGRNDAAREAFYRVVDAAPNHMLAPLASLTIGRMYLDQAEFDRAIPPLRRAAASASGTDILPNAALLLTSAYLLMDGSDAANSILVENRERLTEPPYRNVTAFLGSYARMLSSGQRRQAQREARVLMWAIVGAGRETILGPTGILLIGHAYREVGLGDKMADLYQKALQEGIPAALKPEMSYDIAEHALSTGDVRAAIHGFTDLASHGSGKWNRFARLRLAEIALDDGRPEDCLESCRALLDPRDEKDAAIVLKLMGRAFEQAGIHQKAAVCFAGQIPEF